MRNSIAAALVVLLMVGCGTGCSARVAKRGVHPVISVEIQCVLGGTVNGKWLTHREMAAHMKGGERFRLYSMRKYLGECTVSKPRPEAPGAFPYVEIKPEPSKTENVFGICGKWNALPRIPRKQSVTQPFYLDLVQSVLNEKGLPNSKANITQILRVDLEGNGQDEVLISATTPRKNYGREGMFAKKGDYSFVLLRKIVKGKVKTVLIDGDFYYKNHDPNDDPPTPYVFTIPAVLDMDGDGTLEVIERIEYYEGIFFSVLEWEGEALEVVCSGGAGA